MSLSGDEATVLEIASHGQSMAPIGRWEAPIKALAARGLMLKLDSVNFVITDAGKAELKAHDDALEQNLDATLLAAVNGRLMVAQTQHAIIRYAEAMAQFLAEAGRASHKAVGDDPYVAVNKWIGVIKDRAYDLLDSK